MRLGEEIREKSERNQQKQKQGGILPDKGLFWRFEKKRKWNHHEKNDDDSQSSNGNFFFFY